MKSTFVLSMLVVCGSAQLLRLNSGYGGQRFLEDAPQLTRVIENRPLIQVAEPAPLGLDSSYGQRQLLDVPVVDRPLRVLERPALRVVNDIPITRFNHIINPAAGEYSYDFAGANGIVSKESGFLKGVSVGRVVNGVDSYGYGNTRVEDVVGVAHVKSGETSWCSPEGLRFTLTYTADETGYHPTLTQGLCQQPAYAAPILPAYQPAPVVSAYQPAPLLPAYQPAPLLPAYQPAPLLPAYQPAPLLPAYQPAPLLPAYQPTRLIDAPAY